MGRDVWLAFAVLVWCTGCSDSGSPRPSGVGCLDPGGSSCDRGTDAGAEPDAGRLGDLTLVVLLYGPDEASFLHGALREDHWVKGRRADLSAIRCPVLAIAADTDSICPPAASTARFSGQRARCRNKSS